MMLMGVSDNKWITFALVAVGIFMSTLDGSIVNIALPVIMKDLNVPMTTIEWVPLIYLLTISSLLLAFGRLSDLKGRWWVFYRGFILFSLGSFLCGIARHAIWLVAARSFQGVGAAMLMACSPALVVDIFPPQERGRAMGMIGTVVAAGLTTGPALGGLIINFTSWRYIFYINIPIGIFASIWAYRILKTETVDTPTNETFDWPGAVLMGVCFCSIIIALARLHSRAETGLQVLLFAAIALISAVGLYQLEKKKPHPIFDLSLLGIRLFILPILSAVILFIGVFTMVFLMPFFLVHPAGYSPAKAGYFMVAPFLFLFFISPVSGWISDRIGSRLLCTLGMIVISSGLFFLSRLSASAPYFSIIWRLALMGIGIALFIPPNSAAAMSAVPPQHRGIAGSTLATARNFGMVLGVALAGLVFNSIFNDLSGGLSFKVYVPEQKSAFMTAFQYAMVSGAVVTGVGVIVTFLRGSDSKTGG